MEEISKFDNDSEELHERLQLCNGKSLMIELSNRQNSNKHSELEIELQDTIERINSAKASKQKEIENIEQRISSTDRTVENLKFQMRDAKNKISEQSMFLATLKGQIADAEYSSKRKNIHNYW